MLDANVILSFKDGLPLLQGKRRRVGQREGNGRKAFIDAYAL